ncbi:MAG: hypothetical protein DLM72_12280 [Candidatus Nitrosopolaris wilkensis]|nr:MAG: hypothetical protein DLM72_12280 [Candidatus Nitrosopolaris wilkensis]
MSSTIGNPSFRIVLSIIFVIPVILLSCLITTTALGLSNRLLSSNINGGSINQCVQAYLANANLKSSNNSTVTTNPPFLFAYARSYCTQLAQANINNNQQTTQNQFSSPLLRTPYPYQIPGSYAYQ